MNKTLLLLSLIALFSSSCSSKKKDSNEPQEFSRVYKANFDTVWRGTQQALLNYPMNINNMDTGYLQTLFITGKHRYKAPHNKRVKLPTGYQYRINIKILPSDNDRKTRVSITKDVRMQRDFFSDPKDLTTDGYEEKSLLYRIGREIKVEKILKKAHENSK